MKILYKEITMCEVCPHHRVWELNPTFSAKKGKHLYNCCALIDRGNGEREWKTTMPRYNDAPMEIVSIGCPIGAR